MAKSHAGIVLSLAAISCWAHPVNFECNDPRFDPGNQAMHVYATPNHADSALSFTVDTTTYTHGSQVHLTVEAKGVKFVDQPYGVYLAIRALPRLGYVGDYGQFSNLTHLNLSKGDCPNQVFTPDAFTGKATATWTAGEGTYEDVTLSLLWGNGPGPDDPLAHKFPKISHAYLYLRTIKLQGPNIPSVPPPYKEGVPSSGSSSEATRLRSQGQCVAPLDGSYNLPHSPVFVQKLRTFPAKSVTLPAGQCLPCREDHRQQCASARVDCPTEPGALAVEHLFTTADCSGGPLEVRKLPAAYVHCPGHGSHSPELLDLERFVHKLMRDHAAQFPDQAKARSAIAEYRKLLQLIQKFPELPIVPSKLVDLVWHEHILDTQTYKKDCQRLFGRYIHHAPAFGDESDEAVKTEKEAMLDDQAIMFEQYVAFFEDEPPTNVWPTAQRRLSAGHLPDCCRALCVKPDCASCVGCNAVDCGKMEESIVETSREKETLPESFFGYVPAPRGLLQQLPSCPMTYLCHAQPMSGMNLSWTIAHDYIYMKQTLEGRETWYSVGFSDVKPFDMGLADYIVTLFDRNYSGIRDLYKYDTGNNYPCWDVLSQCSANGTAGTLDLMDRQHFRQDGLATSTWTRKLVTGDYKDSPITDASKKVLFAYGVTDSFTFHGKTQATICDINFFAGEVTCPATKQAEFI